MQEFYNADGKTTIVLTAIHALCLAPMLSVYRALDVGKKRFIDLCIGQMLSILISDAISFMSASLVLKKMPSLEIALLTLAVQTLLCIVWTLSADFLWHKWVPAQKVAVLYSDGRAYESISELHLDSDSFEVVESVCVDGYEGSGKALADKIESLMK